MFNKVEESAQQPQLDTRIEEIVASMKDPSTALLNSTTNNETNNILKKLLMDLFTDDRENLITTFQSVRDNTTNVLSTSDSQLVRAFLDLGGLPLILSVGTKWYNDAGIVKEWLLTLSYIMKVVLQIQYIIYDPLVPAAFNLIILAMKNFPQERLVQLEAVQALHNTFQYVSLIAQHHGAETLKFVHNEMSGLDNDGKGRDNGQDCSFLSYLLQNRTKNFSNDEEMQNRICQLLHGIIRQSQTLRLPAKYAHQLVKFGVLSFLAQIAEIPSTLFETQKNVLSSLQQLSLDYQNYLNANRS